MSIKNKLSNKNRETKEKLFAKWSFLEKLSAKYQAYSQKPKKWVEIGNRYSLIFHALWSMIVYFIIEAFSRHSIIEAFDFMTGSPWVFLYNSLMIFMTFMLVYFFRRRIFVRLLLSVFWLYMGYTNGTVLASRVTPFTGQDIHLLEDLMDIITIYLTPAYLAGIIAAVVITVGTLTLLWKRAPRFQKKINYKLVTLGTAAVIALFAGSTKLALEQRILSTYFGNIAFAYEDYGFPYCFACTLFASGMDKPYEYSKETVDGIITWDEDAEQTDAETGGEQEEEKSWPNIIMLQLETFFDPTTVEFLEFSQDPIPNFRKLMAEYSSGAFKVPSVGAGTANTEFESITGMNLRYFGPGEYPYKTILKKTTCESVAYNLKDIGYTTHAIHNNKATFYSRVDVFKNLGFDTYTSKEYMDVSNVTENGWLKDEVLIGCILDDLMSTENEDFIYAISVQAHGEYPTEKVLEDPVIKVSGAETEEKNYQWEYYVNQLYEVDQFVADLIAKLEKFGEDTVLVMYGDHLPTLGLTVEDVSNRYLFDTSYVIWDNMGLERKEQTLCTYQIAAEVLDMVGIHEGTMMQYHQTRRKSKQYLPDMEMLQYDLLYGKQYAYGGESPYEPTDMTMGAKRATITNVVPLENTLYVFGTNFTTASKVYINDEWQKTTFINDHIVKVKNTTLTEDAAITIKQLAPGQKKRVLSVEGSYEYKQPVPEEPVEQEVQVQEEP